MEKKKALIIGDVHGCLEELEELLDKADYKEFKRVIFVGDLINKGPYSFEVLKLVKYLNADVVIGNHELKFLEYLDNKFEGTPLFAKLRKQMHSHLKGWQEWIKSLPTYIEKKKYLVVHAGLVPDEHPSKSTPRMLANIRTWDGKGENLKNLKNPPWYSYYKGNKVVIHGHWAQQGLHVQDNVVGIDTGCVYGRQLTAIELHSRKIHQVSAKMMYCDPIEQKLYFSL